MSGKQSTPPPLRIAIVPKAVFIGIRWERLRIPGKDPRQGGFGMRIGRMVPVGLIAVFVFLAMGGGAHAMDHAVMKMTKEGLGGYLTDAKMMTLYWFKKDSPGKSACSGPCVEKWPIYFRKKNRSAPDSARREE